MNEFEEFEKEYGPEIFTKLAMSIVNKILVENGLTTEDDLCERMREEINGFLENKNE